MIILTFINSPFIWLCALGSHFGVKMINFGITPQVIAGWNISWESSVPLKLISLFLMVNKEGLCHPTKMWVLLLLGNLIFMIFGMEAKKKLISWISLALYFLRLDSLLFLIIYPYKLIILTFINPPLIWLCALGSHFGVKMIIYSFTPKVMVGWNISWESSVPLQPISLFLRVNKEGLCDGTKIWVELYSW